MRMAISRAVARGHVCGTAGGGRQRHSDLARAEGARRWRPAEARTPGAARQRDRAARGQHAGATHWLVYHNDLKRVLILFNHADALPNMCCYDRMLDAAQQPERAPHDRYAGETVPADAPLLGVRSRA